METYRCDGCSTITDRPCLEITRAGGMGGGGVRITGRPWHLCLGCSQQIDQTIGAIRNKTAK